MKYFLMLLCFIVLESCLNAQDFDLNFNTGKSFRKTLMYDSALVYFSRAIELKPNDIDAYMERAWIYETVCNLKGALNDYTKIIEIDSLYFKAYQGRANIYMKTNQKTKELQDYQKVIQLAPYDEGTYYSYLNTELYLYKSNKLDAALYYINKAIEMTQRYKYFTGSSCYYERGLIFFKKRDFQKALEDFTTAINQGFQFADCYLMRSKTFKKLGLKENGRQDIEMYDLLMKKSKAKP